MPRPDRGIALLEVLLASVILSASGLALVGLVSAGLQAERQARDRERSLATEDRLMAGLTLLRRSDLDRRLGRHPFGGCVVDVERPEPTLYRIAIAREGSHQVEEVVTVVYRPEPSK
jgi:type II secretory pathway component PulJ